MSLNDDLIFDLRKARRREREAIEALAAARAAYRGAVRLVESIRPLLDATGTLARASGDDDGPVGPGDYDRDMARAVEAVERERAKTRNSGIPEFRNPGISGSAAPAPGEAMRRDLAGRCAGKVVPREVIGPPKSVEATADEPRPGSLAGDPISGAPGSPRRGRPGELGATRT
jgi:hypothetical protein